MKKQWILVLFFLLLMVDLYLIFIFAPVEKTQGLVQKIFYFHVSSAFAMYFGFLIAAIFSGLYLWKKKSHWNSYSHAGAATGLLFCTMVLISGPLWAKPVWGAWWTWDPRLTTTLLIWLIFFATLLLRDFFGNDPRGKTYASILTLLGLLDMPLIFFAVKLWRGIHPSVLGKKGSMPMEMKITLIFTNVTVLFLFFLIYWVFCRLLKAEEKVKSIAQSSNVGS